MNKYFFLAGLAVLFISELLPTQCIPFTNESSAGPQDEQGELLLLQFIFRHGSRTPYWLYKNDRYKESDFPEGIGMLVNQGKEQMYKYGQLIRQRYAHFLGKVAPKEIYSESSPSRRCIETSLAVLAGMFPPSDLQVWSNSSVISQHWQPIAVQSVEKSRSWKLNPDCPCPVGEQIENSTITEVPELKAFLEENKQFVQRLSNQTGENFASKSWMWVGNLYDTLFTEQRYFGDSFEKPDWLDSDTAQILKQFNDYEFKIFGQNPDYIKLKAGSILQEMIENQKRVAVNGDRSNKVFTYATHDNLISPIMHALGLFKEQPSLGSGLIWELRKDARTGQTNVHLFYANGTADGNFDIYTLELNKSVRFSDHCRQVYCSLSDFKRSLQDYVLLENVEQKCNQ